MTTPIPFYTCNAQGIFVPVPEDAKSILVLGGGMSYRVDEKYHQFDLPVSDWEKCFYTWRITAEEAHTIVDSEELQPRLAYPFYFYKDYLNAESWIYTEPVISFRSLLSSLSCDKGRWIVLINQKQ